MSFEHAPAWFFVPEDPNHRMRSTARRHALEGSNLSTEARVVREAIQNSVDATLDGEKTDVLIWNRTISEEEVVEFRRLIGFKDEDSPFARLPKLRLKAGNAYEALCPASAAPVPVTIIEDRNTCGLGYDEDDDKDRFVELCLSFGQDTTGVSSKRGGSYGFGKEVYEEASNCNTFFVYSVFEPHKKIRGGGGGGVHARFFGCATFDGHYGGDGVKYTGRALFGVEKKNERQQIECLPLVDAEAHEVASRLGFVKRDQGETGTSIMIVGSHVDMEEVKPAVEDYWWPRIQSNQLHVELWQGGDQGADEVSQPEPRQRPDLSPYIRCYSLIEESVPKEDGERIERLNSTYGAKPGQIALKALEPRDPDAAEDSVEDTYLENTIALIRSGPRMVVEYMNPGGAGAGRFVGVFVSDPEAEEALHLSEPPSHDAWNPNSQRLHDAYPESAEKSAAAQKIVESVLRRIKNRGREFQKSLTHTPPPVRVEGTRRLEQILARLMSAAGPVPVPASRGDPFEVRIHERRVNGAAHSRLNAAVEVGLKQDAPVDSTRAVMSLYPAVVLDDALRRDPSERLPLASVTVNGTDVKVDGFDVSLVIFKAQTTVVEVESACFERELYASLDVRIHVPTQTEPEGG